MKTKVLAKYGDIYGRERIAELLGMDLASLDVSAMTQEKKPEPESGMLSWYVNTPPLICRKHTVHYTNSLVNNLHNKQAMYKHIQLVQLVRWHNLKSTLRQLCEVVM